MRFYPAVLGWPHHWHPSWQGSDPINRALEGLVQWPLGQWEPSQLPQCWSCPLAKGLLSQETGGLNLQQKASVFVWGRLTWGHPEQQRGPILHRG